MRPRRLAKLGVLAAASLAVCSLLAMPADAAKKDKKPGKPAGKQSGDKAGFKAFDIDNDTRLSPAEYKTMAETKPKKAARGFKQVDTDGDGFITIEEYRASFKAKKLAKKSKGK